MQCTADPFCICDRSCRIRHTLRTLEAVTLPLDGKTLLDDESFSIVAQWQDGKDDRTDIPIYIVNHTDRNYEFSTQDVTVNGYCLDDFCSFYADVPSGET